MRPSRARVCAAQWLVVGCLFRRPLDAASTAPGRCVAAATMDAGIVFALGALLCAALNDIVFKKAVGAGLSVGWFASMIGTTWGLVQVCGRFRPQSPSLPLPSLPPPSPPPPLTPPPATALGATGTATAATAATASTAASTSLARRQRLLPSARHRTAGDRPLLLQAGAAGRVERAHAQVRAVGRRHPRRRQPRHHRGAGRHPCVCGLHCLPSQLGG